MKVIVYENKGETENEVNVGIPELRFRVGDFGLILRKFIRDNYWGWVPIEIDNKGKIWYLLGYWELIAEGLEETSNEKQRK
jgi:hypothetical protein